MNDERDEALFFTYSLLIIHDSSVQVSDTTGDAMKVCSWLHNSYKP